jgi:uncharacterized protein
MKGNFRKKDGRLLSYEKIEGKSPCIMYLHGFMSSKQAFKASFIKEFCIKTGQAYFAFDATGHGESDGGFEDILVGTYLNDALEITDALIDMPFIPVGSSFGGWIAVLLSIARQKKIPAFIGLAPALDFTQEVWDIYLTEENKEELRSKKIIGPNEKTLGYVWSYQLFEEGKNHLLLQKESIPYDGYALLINGDKDEQVPFKKSLKIREKLSSASAQTWILKEAGHDLSRPLDLQTIQKAIELMLDFVAFKP